MGKVVILEGPDGGGKSTLAAELVKKGFAYRHFGPPDPGVDMIEFYLRHLNEAIEEPEVPTVFDRLYLGETIYGPIMRGQDRIGGRKGIRLFQRLIQSRDVLEVFCIPSHDTMRDNYARKMTEKDDYVKGFENFWKICDGYLQALHIMPKAMTFNYQKDTYYKVLGVSGWPRITLPKGTIGSIIAKYLFVGDIPNHPSVDVPFFSLKNSSGYFNDALERAEISEESIALSNAYSPHSLKPRSLRELRTVLPNLEKIFLMGNRAQVWYSNQPKSEDMLPVEVKSIPHPQYLKRFQGSDPVVMARIIKENL